MIGSTKDPRTSKPAADDWWLFEVDATTGSGAIAVPARPRHAPSRTLKGQLTDAAAQAVYNALHSRAVRLALVATTVLSILGIMFGVITLNNIVMQRSVELGKLDTERRQLRTQNALLNAEIAKLSAPPRIVAVAKKRLGMQPSAEVSTFIYLDPPKRAPARPAATTG